MSLLSFYIHVYCVCLFVCLLRHSSAVKTINKQRYVTLGSLLTRCIYVGICLAHGRDGSLPSHGLAGPVLPKDAVFHLDFDERSCREDTVLSQG